MNHPAGWRGRAGSVQLERWGSGEASRAEEGRMAQGHCASTGTAGAPEEGHLGRRGDGGGLGWKVGRLATRVWMRSLEQVFLFVSVSV